MKLIGIFVILVIVEATFAAPVLELNNSVSSIAGGADAAQCATGGSDSKGSLTSTIQGATGGGDAVGGAANAVQGTDINITFHFRKCSLMWYGLSFFEWLNWLLILPGRVGYEQYLRFDKKIRTNKCEFSWTTCSFMNVHFVWNGAIFRKRHHKKNRCHWQKIQTHSETRDMKQCVCCSYLSFRFIAFYVVARISSCGAVR